MLTYQDVAEHLKVSERTVRRLIKSGVLPAARVGRQVRIRREDLEAYVTRAKG